jgi:hypothetical protein
MKFGSTSGQSSVLVSPNRPLGFHQRSVGRLRESHMERSELEKLVNRSGFLFQMAVEEHIRANTNNHGWEVAAREYPWSSPLGDRRGFIDIIADRSYLHSVVECKRTQGGEWIFLVPSASKETLRLRTLWSYLTDDRRQGYGWDDLHFTPATLESEFCIVRGGSDDDKPMLERIVGDLVRASESLAREQLDRQGRHPGPAGYIPLIVTNAKLYACRVDPRDVDLQTGSVPSSAVFEETDAIRFRKATASDIEHTPSSYGSIRDGLKKKERSSVVVNVERLSDWLISVSEEGSGLSAPPRPWRHLEK